MSGQNERTFVQFTQESTMHGIRYATRVDISKTLRIIWLIVIAGFGIYFMVGTALFVRDYARKTVNTKVKIKDKHSLKFPTVTICNRNYIKRSAMGLESMPDYPELAAMQSELLADLYLVEQLPVPIDKYNWSDPLLAPFARTDVEGRELLEDKILGAAHHLEETFKHCIVKDEVVDCKTIFEHIKTDAGYCFQFNSDGNFTTHSAGISGGISIVMDTMTDEYYIGPHSYSEGFSVGFHDTDEIHLIEELSYGVSPGFETSFIIYRKEIDRVPPPADGDQADCMDTKTEANTLRYHKNYSQSGCFEECKVAFVINQCGCRDVYHPKLNGIPACNVKEMLYCSNPALKEFSRNYEHLEECHCQSKCYEISYTAQLSTYVYPSKRMVEALNFSESLIETMKKNYVVIKIAYGRMSYESIEEYIAYTGHDLIANVGGTMGVCIGASFLTLVEFIEFMVVWISKRMHKKSISKNQSASIHPVAE